MLATHLLHIPTLANMIIVCGLCLQGFMLHEIKGEVCDRMLSIISYSFAPLFVHTCLLAPERTRVKP